MRKKNTYLLGVMHNPQKHLTNADICKKIFREYGAVLSASTTLLICEDFILPDQKENKSAKLFSGEKKIPNDYKDFVLGKIFEYIPKKYAGNFKADIVIADSRQTKGSPYDSYQRTLIKINQSGAITVKNPEKIVSLISSFIKELTVPGTNFLENMEKTKGPKYQDFIIEGGVEIDKKRVLEILRSDGFFMDSAKQHCDFIEKSMIINCDQHLIEGYKKHSSKKYTDIFIICGAKHAQGILKSNELSNIQHKSYVLNPKPSPRQAYDSGNIKESSSVLEENLTKLVMENPIGFTIFGLFMDYNSNDFWEYLLNTNK